MSKLTTSSDIGTCLSESEKLNINSNDMESIFIKNTEYRKVKHAHWESILFGGEEWGIKCSNCNTIDLYGKSTYCPNCGAKIDEVE